MLLPYSKAAAQCGDWYGTLGNDDWHDVVPVSCFPDVCFLTNWFPGPNLFPCLPSPADVVYIESGEQVRLVQENAAILGLNLEGRLVMERDLSVGGTSTIDGALEWRMGDLEGFASVTNNGTVEIFTGHSKNLEYPLFVNQGTVTWYDNGEIDFISCLFQNNGTFEIRNDQVLSGSGSSFENTGVLRKVFSTGVTRLTGDLPLNNSGTVEVLSGKLEVQSGGTSQSPAVFFVESGAFVDFDVLPYTFDDGTSIQGPGTARIVAILATMSGNVSAHNLELDTGSLDGLGNLTTTGTLGFAGDGTKFIQLSSINNQGTAVWTGLGNIGLQFGVQFNNPGLFDARNDAAISNEGSTNTFSNSGTFRKSAGAGTTLINSNVSFMSSGSIAVESGTLALKGGGESTGPIQILAGAALDVPDFIYTLGPGCSISGPGPFRVVDGSTVTLTGSIPAEQFVVVSATGPGRLDGAGELTITGGLELAGGSDKTLAMAALHNAGSVEWRDAGDIYLQNGIVVNNAGNFTARNDQSLIPIAPYGAFNNSGAFVKDGGSGTTTVAAGIPFNNTGTVNVVTGTLIIAGGGTSTGGVANGLGRGAARGVTGVWQAGPGAVVAFTTNPYLLDSGTGFQGDGYARVQGSTVSVTGPLVASNLALDSGLLTGGDLTVSSSLEWWDGVHSGTGLTVIGPTGGLEMKGAADKMLQRNLRHEGSGSWEGPGNIRLGGGVTLEIAGTWTAGNDAEINWQSGAGNRVLVSGNLVKSGSAGSTRVESQIGFDNTGRVDVQTGSLEIKGGGTSSGEFALGPGGSVVIGSTNLYTFDSGASVTGPGFLRNAGIVTLNGNAAADNCELSGSGSFTGPEDLVVRSSFNWLDGVISGAGTMTVDSTASLILPDATAKRVQRPLLNRGSAQWTGTGAIRLANGVTFENAGVFTASADAEINWQTGTGNRFLNSGTFIKSGGAGITRIGPQILFENSGLVRLDSGSLEISGGGLSTGDFALASGTSVVVPTTNGFTLDAGSQVTGDGVFRVPGIVTLQGDAAAENFELSGGTVNGPGGLSLTGHLDWSGGAMSGTGMAQVEPGGTAALNGTADKRIQRPFVAGGATAWSGTGNIRLFGGITFENAGTMTATSDAQINWQGGSNNRFRNSGTFIKSGTAGISSIPSPIVLDNPGTIEIRTGTVRVGAAAVQQTGSILAGGTWRIFDVCTLDLQAGSNITTNRGQVELVGPTSTFSRINTLTLNEGSFALGGGRVFTTPSSLTNAGYLGIDETSPPAGGAETTPAGEPGAVNQGVQSMLQVGGAGQYIQSSGETVVNGSLTAPGGVAIQAGVLRGDGTVIGNVATAGTVSPGSAVGTLLVSGDFAQSAGGRFRVDLEGLPAGAYDQLEVSGAVQLDGTLEVALILPFIPAAGDSFVIIRAGAVTGSFASIEGKCTGSGPEDCYLPVYTDSTVVLVITAPPISAVGETPPGDPGPGDPGDGVGSEGERDLLFRIRMEGQMPVAELFLAEAAQVTVTVHDVLGRLVARLPGGRQEAGRHRYAWDGISQRASARPGVYFVRCHVQRDGRAFLRSGRFLLIR